MPILTSIAIALALAPAVVAWWTGRAVLTRVDDPVLPELLFERRRKLTGLTLGGALVLAILFADDALWAIPLLWIALLVSSYPLRRALFGERWNAFTFLRYSIFSAIGHVGIWLLAGFAPAIVTTLAIGLAPDNTHEAVRIALWTGAAIGLVLALWQHHYARVFLALHRAEPLRASASAELMAKLDAILERARAALPRRPETYRYGPPGAYVMNAFAIPSLGHPAVALGSTLLATLTDDEVAAVYAHEIAHHEQFTRKRLWRAWLAGIVLAAITAGLPALFLRTTPGVALPASWCVPLLVVIALSRRAAKRRDAETASDLRASVLTGNPTAVASALTKLHVYSRVPRRWPHGIERVATHPSLARRIQALRERSGVIEPHVPEVNAIVRATSGTVIALDRDRVYWFEGVPTDAPLALDTLRSSASSYRAMAYRDLAELRVGAEGDARTIVATDLDNRSWSAPIAPNDVPALQAALDQVDVKLGQRRAAAAPASAPAVRWLALALLIMLAMSGELGVALIPLLVVLVRPALTAAVAATAAIALARILVAARVIAWADPIRQIAALGSVAVAVTLIVLAARRARADSTRGAARRITREAWLLIGGLAVIIAPMAVAILPVAGERPASLIGNPLAISASVVLLGLGGALLTLPQRWWRATGALLSCIAIGAGAIVSSDAWPFGRADSLKWTTSSLTAAGSVPIPGGGLTINASPNGSAFAVSQYHATRGRPGEGQRFVIGRIDDSQQMLRTSDALNVAFADDETILAIEARGTDSLELRAERVTADPSGGVPVVWRERLPLVEDPQLIVDRPRRTWIVAGRGDDDRSFVIVSDSFGGNSPRVHRIPESSAEDETGEVMTRSLAAFPDGSAIWVTLAKLRTKADALTPVLLSMTGSIRWELRSSGPAGERFLADVDGFPTCGIEIEGGRVLCADRSPNATRVWRATPATIERVADLPPTLDIVHVGAPDRVAATERFGTRLVVVDPTARRGTRLTLPGSDQRLGTRWTADVVVRGDNVLVLSGGRDRATVARYRVRN